MTSFTSVRPAEEEEFFGEGNDDDEPGPQTAPPQHSNGIITSLQMTFPPRLVDYEDDEEDLNHTAPGATPCSDTHDVQLTAAHSDACHPRSDGCWMRGVPLQVKSGLGQPKVMMPRLRKERASWSSTLTGHTGSRSHRHLF